MSAIVLLATSLFGISVSAPKAAHAANNMRAASFDSFFDRVRTNGGSKQDRTDIRFTETRKQTASSSPYATTTIKKPVVATSTTPSNATTSTTTAISNIKTSPRLDNSISLRNKNSAYATIGRFFPSNEYEAAGLGTFLTWILTLVGMGSGILGAFLLGGWLDADILRRQVAKFFNIPHPTNI